MKDFYLNIENSYNRLLIEYQKYQSLVVAFDFDNTVYDYHSQGHTYLNVVKLLQELKEIGCYLIIFTANEDEVFVKNYCNKEGIPFDIINDNPPFYNSKSRKIYYNVLLDDRAGLRQVFDALSKLVNNIKQ